MSTTTTLSAADRAEINRRNARKSTGPRSPEGKARSRFNALKHGLAAKEPVLPGEDPEVYRGRIDAWTADLRPRNQAELVLIEQAARTAWQLERAEPAGTARLASLVRERALC